MRLAAQEVQLVTKETQKFVLRAVCEHPTYSIEELTLHLKNVGKSITHDEVLQVLSSIAPNKNWSRASVEEVQREILEYLWTLEAQILFLLPVKQKETTIAEFNQLRLRNKQPKISKDLIRHVQSLLMVEGKSLSKFRKYEKEQTILSDVDPTTQAVWSFRMLLCSIDSSTITNLQEFSNRLLREFREKYPILAEKVGKTIQRITERFIENYFPKSVSDLRLRELINLYQSIYGVYKKKGVEGEVLTHKEFQDQNKIVQNAIEELNSIQKIVNKSHEGGFVSKLVSGKVKNREDIVSAIDKIITSLNELIALNNSTNKANMDQALLVQKLQTDYENILLVKNQLDNDLYDAKDRLKFLEDKKVELEKELNDKTESLERAHEKIAELQQTVDRIPEYENKQNMLREELNTAKEIAMKIHRRIEKLKSDLQKVYWDKQKADKQIEELRAKSIS